MINWISIVLIAAGAFLGAELGQRWAIEQGRQVIFQPRWSYRVLNLLIVFGVVLFLEAARVTLTAPTMRHVWFLIAGGVWMLAGTWIQLARELQLAKREIERLKSAREPNPTNA